jgi:autotransporter-associated beta strand protein
MKFTAVLSVLTSLSLVSPAVVRGDGRSFNTSGTLDWLMVEERRPYNWGVQWSPFNDNLHSVVSTEGASFSYYTGFGFGGTVPYWHWSAWPIANPINTGDAISISYLGQYTWGHAGNGSEGTAAGMDNSPAPPFVTTNVWYRFAMRTWLPADGTPHQGYVGEWVRDGATGNWYHFGTYQTPFTAKGINGVGGFMENFCKTNQSFRIDHRNCFAHQYGAAFGTWERANVCSVGGNAGSDYFAAPIENGTATMIEFFGSDCATDPLGTNHVGNGMASANGTTVPVTMTNQPATPLFDPIIVSNATATVYGSQLLVQWQTPPVSSPQLSYKVEVFNNSGYTGSPAVTWFDRDTEAQQKLLNIAGVSTPYVRLTITDIFDNTNTPVLITPTAAVLNPATNVAGTVNGLSYQYYQTNGSGVWTNLPNFAALTPAEQGVAAYPDMSLRLARAEYAFNFNGYFMAPSNGIYTFKLTSYDSSKLVIDGQTVVDFTGLHQPGFKSGAVALQAGLHSVNLQYAFSDQRGQCQWWDGIWLSCEGPGITNSAPSPDMFCPGLVIANNPNSVPVPLNLWYRVPGNNEPAIVLTAPANNATLCGSNTPVSVNIVTNGASGISQVQYYWAGISQAQVNQAPFSTSLFLGEAPANYLRARLFYNNGWTVDSAPPNVVAVTNMDVTPWTITAIGQQHFYPTAGKVAGSTISIQGDSVNTISRQVTGDCTFIAHLAGITSSATLPDGSVPQSADKAGIVLRQSLDPSNGDPLGGHGNTDYWAAFGEVNGNIYYEDSTMAGGNGAPNRTSGNLGSSNKWLMLQRVGDTCTTSVSPDGVNWTAVNTNTQAGIGSTLYAAVFNFTSWNLLPYIPNASFDNVSLTGNILGPPSVYITPQTATVFTGQSATFTAVASAAPPFYYQWQQNGVNLAGATNATLTLTNLQPTDSALYSVIVTNANGSDSATAPLTVLTPSPGVAAGAILSNNPVAYWRLNETAGPTAYDSVGNFNGTGQGGIAFGVPGVAGAPFTGFENNNLGAHFNGADSDVSIPALNLNTNAVTITAWVKRSGNQAQWSGIFFSRASGTTSGLHFGTTNDLHYTWNNSGSTYNWASGLVPPDGAWTFVALAISPTNAVMYMSSDGTLQSAANAVANVVQGFTGASYLGYDPSSSSRRINGTLDEVAVFNRTLPRSQIAQILAASLVTPLSVSLTAPASGATFGDDSTITLTASVVTNGHAITGVRFYNGAVLLGQSSAAPYSFSWTNVSAGAYTLLAAVTYDGGSVLYSAPVFITVNPTPDAPAGITPLALANNLISVSWPPSLGATGYLLSRNGSAIVALAGTSYFDLGLAPNTTYAYSVVATNVWGDSPASVTNSGTTFSSGAALWWDANGSANSPQDGNGTWGNTAYTWWDTASNVAWANGSVALFGNGTTTNCAVLLTNNVTPGGMVFNANNGGSYSFSSSGGSQVALSGAPLLLCNEDVLFSCALSGSGQLNLSGPGAVTLMGTNIFTGATTINGGSLTLGGGARLGSGSYGGNLTNNGTLAYASTNTQTMSGAISGNGSLTTVAGSGNLTLSGANSYSGGTTVTTKSDVTALTVVNNTALGTGPVLYSGKNHYLAGIAINSGLTVTNSFTLAPAGDRSVISLAAGAQLKTGTLTVDGSGGTGDAIIITSGSSGSPAVVAQNITLAVGSANQFDLRGGGSYGKFTGSFSYGTATVALLDNSTWEWSGSGNTYGTLSIANASATVYCGATNTLSPAGIVQDGNAGGTLKLSNLAGTAAYDQTIAGLSQSVKVTTSTGTPTLALVNTNASLSCTNTGVLSGTLSLLKAGAFTQTLTASNTYNGGTTVSGGVLAVTVPGGLGRGNVVVANGATLTLGTNSPTAITSGYISSTNNLAMGSAALANLNFVGTNTIKGLSLDGGATYLPVGTYGSPGSPAANKSPSFTGTGIINATATPSVAALTLVSSTNPSTPGQSVTFTNKATGSSGTPTGTVTFKDGTQTLSTVGLVSGVAICTTANLAIGAHVITASYSGDATYVPGVSPVLAQAVNPAPPVINGGLVWSGNGVRFSFSGPNGQTYRVLASPDVSWPMPSWWVLTNGIFGAAPAAFTDGAATNDAKFYRVVSP